MIRCPSCASELEDSKSSCPRCGARLDPSSGPTQTGLPPQRAPSPGPATPPASSGEGRFPPGTLLARRYRIVGPLGKGGMGEVYRAEDLKLGQPVALKFLPESLATDPAWLARFHNEVRVAREVTHPNVCRVHDIGEADGQHFLSMEYVDGEDLASLLRRIGRLPKDKGIEIARQVCSGLAAAHDRGVLHRDLKPANVMIDGRGRARLTDFGLAGLADSAATDDAAGTPAYMAPEQFEGKGVSVRSDVYALGLVLYEVFTGKPAFRGKTVGDLARAHKDSAPTRPTQVVDDLDPALERVILRCLEKDPRARPASALAVAAALPGGDPLAAALAAGVTPSPEMVAAAGEGGGLQPRAALIWLGAFLASLTVLLALLLRHPTAVAARVRFEKPPEVLADRARSVLARLGYDEAPSDSASGFTYDWPYFHYLMEKDASTTSFERLATGQPAAVFFWYRQASEPLFPGNMLGRIRLFDDPPPMEPGMATVCLDAKGRLLYLAVVPPRSAEGLPAPTPPDWSVLLTEGGFDIARFRPVEPARTPVVYADTRAAWEGAYPDRPEVPIRLEAAAYRGRPVSFEIIGPWRRAPAASGGGSGGLAASIPFIITLVLLAGGAFLARRNLRLGRGDRRGAFRLALAIFALDMLRWVLQAAHVPQLTDEFDLLMLALGKGLYDAALLWLFYLSLEPYVRRLWPETLIGWSRILTGRFRDPLVGRDVLLGCGAGVFWAWLGSVAGLAPEWLGQAPRLSAQAPLMAWLGTPHIIGQILGGVQFAVFLGLFYLFSLTLFRIACRGPRLAAALFLLVHTAAAAGWVGAVVYTSSRPTDWPMALIVVGMLLLLLVRLGLVAAIAAGLFPAFNLFSAPLAPDLTAWNAPAGLVPILLLAALAIYGFHTSLGGRPLLKDALLQD